MVNIIVFCVSCYFIGAFKIQEEMDGKVPVEIIFSDSSSKYFGKDLM